MTRSEFWTMFLGYQVGCTSTKGGVLIHQGHTTEGTIYFVMALVAMAFIVYTASQDNSETI
jgi:hypothetical protein